jgi:uncharacterized cupin superfamily protein
MALISMGDNGMARHKNITNINDLNWESGGNRDKFAFERKWFTPKVGGQKLGCSLYRVPPGKTAFPFHKHFTNEEAIYVLAGKGTIRLEDQEFEVGPGDYIALPPEGPNHQLINTGVEDLDYLCISTIYTKLALPLDIMTTSSVDERAPKLELVAVDKRTRGIIPHSDCRYSTATILIAAF